MGRTRYLVAAALLLGALCADHALAAAPSMQPQTMGFAQRLVTRLSVGFRRTVTSHRFFADRQLGTLLACSKQVVSHPAPTGFHQLRSPFNFRLPPPALA